MTGRKAGDCGEGVSSLCYEKTDHRIGALPSAGLQVDCMNGVHNGNYCHCSCCLNGRWLQVYVIHFCIVAQAMPLTTLLLQLWLVTCASFFLMLRAVSPLGMLKTDTGNLLSGYPFIG